MTRKPKIRPELEALAFEMRARLCEDGQPRWRLSSGIELVLTCQWGGYLTLLIKRIEQAPSTDEVAAIRAAFGVPEDATVRAFARKMISAKTRAMLLYRGFELRWWECGGDGREKNATDGDWASETERQVQAFVERLALREKAERVS